MMGHGTRPSLDDFQAVPHAVQLKEDWHAACPFSILYTVPHLARAMYATFVGSAVSLSGSHARRL